ncbi:MAG TPA: PDZ domain-containing protein [Gemmatimonadaceae bacterium]|jgi:serine protease Do
MAVGKKSFVLALVLCGGVAMPHSGIAQGIPLAESQTPKGWFGVMISDQVLLNESGTAFFDRYPVVSKVEDGSPAAKAGVRPGDVLMTFNSHDMRGSAFEMDNWLKPGARFELRLRRNDRIRIVRGIVQPRPENWAQKITMEVTPMDETVIARTPDGATTSGLRTVYIDRSKMRSPARLPSILVPALGFGSGLYPFAGAEFTAMNDDLSEVLGVKGQGVFVTNVIAGSLARTSGLRGGDVVVMADSIRVENPNDLVKAIRSANDQSVRLQIIRKHKPQAVVLRWSAPHD